MWPLASILGWWPVYISVHTCMIMSGLSSVFPLSSSSRCWPGQARTRGATLANRRSSHTCRQPHTNTHTHTQHTRYNTLIKLTLQADILPPFPFSFLSSCVFLYVCCDMVCMCVRSECTWSVRGAAGAGAGALSRINKKGWGWGMPTHTHTRKGAV